MLLVQNGVGAHSTPGVYQEGFLKPPKLRKLPGSFLGFGDPRNPSCKDQELVSVDSRWLGLSRHLIFDQFDIISDLRI